MLLHERVFQYLESTGIFLFSRGFSYELCSYFVEKISWLKTYQTLLPTLWLSTFWWPSMQKPMMLLIIINSYVVWLTIGAECANTGALLLLGLIQLWWVLDLLLLSLQLWKLPRKDLWNPIVWIFNTYLKKVRIHDVCFLIICLFQLM
jgi:hypothetical protein